MIKSRFSKAILPLAFTTAISGGMLVKTSVKPSPEKHEIKTEQPAKTNPIEDPAVLGTIFSLGLLGTAGAATLGKAVDVRYREAHEKLEEIYDLSTLTEDDYKEAFEDACKELDSKGENYDKEALKKQYTPKSKEEIVKMIDANKAHIKRVTENCYQDSKAATELSFLEEELKSAVKYGKTPSNDDIKYQMLYKFDKATLPPRQWNKVETTYKSEHPEIDFDKQIGVSLDKKWEHFAKVAAAKLILDKEIFIDNPEDLLKSLHEIKDHINTQPEILNKYDREECLKLIAEATNKLEKGDNQAGKLYQEIIKIYVCNQRTYS